MKILMLITVLLIFLFNSGVNGQSLSEFKTQVAEQLTEAFDRIILNEKLQANNTKEIKFLKTQLEDLKKEYAQETEKRVRNENKQAKEIQELGKKHKENEEEIEFLKQKVEDLQKFQAPETCYQLKKQGVTRGQDIYLDSDGFNHGKKQLLMIFSSPCSFWIRFCSLNFGPA